MTRQPSSKRHEMKDISLSDICSDDGTVSTCDNVPNKRVLVQHHNLRPSDFHRRADSPVPLYDPPPIPVTRTQFWSIFVILCVGMICNGLDSNLLGDAAPVIAQHFKAFNQISWLSGANLLVVVSTLLAAGRLFDLFTPKYIYLVALIFYSTGEAISGASTSIGMLLAGRAITGIGLAAVDVASFSVIALITDSKERPLYMSLVMGMFGLMIKVGPIVSGALLRKSERLWRWCFFLQLPIQACLIVATLLLFPPIALKRRAYIDGQRSFDVVGFVLQASAMALLLVPLLLNTDGLVALIVCYAILPFTVVAFFWHTWRLPESRRLIPLEAMLESRSILCIAVVTFGANLIIFTSTFYYPQYFQLVRGATALKAALYLLPCALSGTVACVLTGELSERVRYYSPLAISGSLLEIVGALLLATVKVHTPISTIIGYTVIAGTGAGSLTGLGFAVVMARVSKSRFGAGGSFINLTTFIGPAIGIALNGLMIDLKLDSFAAMAHEQYPETVPLASALAQDASSFLEIPNLPHALLHQFKYSYNAAQSQAAYVYLAVGILSLIASCVTKHEGITPLGSIEAGVEDDSASDISQTKPHRAG